MTSKYRLPCDVADHLYEGNDKADLIELFWDMLTPIQQQNLMKEVRELNADPMGDKMGKNI